ncbi:MAG: thiamine-phosphate kinase [bacterium]
MREFDFLARVFATNHLLPKRVSVPPGDDMAVIDLGDGSDLLIAADGAIEGRHAPWGCDPFLIGRKAVLRNLSDVAAMANARPVAIVATAVLPRDTSEERAWRLYEGLRETAAAWDAPLVGGDIARTSSDDPRAPIETSVAIVAVPRRHDRGFALRSNARVGDGIYVTGTIGGAWNADGSGRHLDFTPRLRVAHALDDALGERLGAMIDVSDGLGRDLGHIARLSRVAMEIELERVPVTRGVDPREAIAQGEDYELAFTARGDVPAELAGVAITRVGSVVAGDLVVRVRDGARSFDAVHAGFEHTDGERRDGGAE